MAFNARASPTSTPPPEATSTSAELHRADRPARVRRLTFANLLNGAGNVAGAELSLTTVPEPWTSAAARGVAALGAAGYSGRRHRASIVD